MKEKKKIVEKTDICSVKWLRMCLDIALSSLFLSLIWCPLSKYVWRPYLYLKAFASVMGYHDRVEDSCLSGVFFLILMMKVYF